MEIIDALSIIDAKAKFSDDCNFQMAVATIHKELAEALKPSHNKRVMPCCPKCKGTVRYSLHCDNCGDFVGGL